MSRRGQSRNQRRGGDKRGHRQHQGPPPRPDSRLTVRDTQRDDALVRHVINAVNEGDVEQLTRLVRGNPEIVNGVDKWRRTGALVAAQRGNATILAVLLAHGADMFVADASGHTVIGSVVGTAPNSQQSEKSDIISTSSRSTEKQSRGGRRARRRRQQEDTFEDEVQHDFQSVPAQNFDSLRILMSHPDAVSCFDVNDAGVSPFVAAIQSGNIAIVALLLAFGVTRSVELDAGPLTATRLAPNFEIISKLSLALTEHQRDWAHRVPIGDDGDDAPPAAEIVIAAGAGAGSGAASFPSVVPTAQVPATPASLRALINAPAKVEFVGLRGTSDLVGIQRLLDAGVVVNARVDGEVPLIVAIRRGDLTTASLLLYNGADITQKSAEGENVLTVAANTRNLEQSYKTCRLLLSHPALIKALESDQFMADDQGNTALHIAAKRNAVALIRMLRLFRPFQRASAMLNNAGRSPAQLATERLAIDSIEYDLNSRPREGAPTIITPTAPSAHPACIVCMLPPPDEEDLALLCAGCQSPFCEECLVHLGQSCINRGEYPQCPRDGCSRDIPIASFQGLLSTPQMLMITSLSVNKSSTVDALHRQACPICSRYNDISPVYQNATPRYPCSHCGVNICAVCTTIWPSSTADSDIHQPCLDKAPTLGMFGRFHAMLMELGLRRCPRNPQTCSPGVKDDACCHVHCSTCPAYYCYTCGFVDGDDGVSLGTHCHNNVEQWSHAPAECPQYLSTLCRIDPRVRAAGCGRTTCDQYQLTDCGNTATCRTARDRVAMAVLSTLRLRAGILRFMQEVGKRRFLYMLRVFNFKNTVDANFFNGSFPWDGDEIPDLLTFEPEEVRTFYGARRRWFSS